MRFQEVYFGSEHTIFLENAALYKVVYKNWIVW